MKTKQKLRASAGAADRVVYLTPAKVDLVADIEIINNPRLYPPTQDEGFPVVVEEDRKSKPFSMVAYTGGLLHIRGFAHPVVIDLNGVSVGSSSGQVGITLDHKPDKRVGHTTKIDVTRDGIIAEGWTSAKTTSRDEVIDSASNGFVWQASIEGRVVNSTTVKSTQSVRVNGCVFKGPVIVARKFVLSAISFVTSGGDEENQVHLAAQHEEDDMSFTEWLEGLGISEGTLTEDGRKVLKSQYEAINSPKPANPKPANPKPANPEPGPEPVGEIVTANAGSEVINTDEVLKEIRREAAAEEKRIAAVSRICRKHPDLVASAISEGWDETKAELAVLRAERDSFTAIHAEEPAGGPNGQDVLVASLCAGTGIPLDQLQYDDDVCHEATRQRYRNISLHTLLYDTIRAAGRSVRPGPITDDVIREAAEADGILRAAGAGFSTTSLSGTLSNVANKALLAAYNAVPVIATQVCATRSVNDFKQHTSYRVTTQGLLLELGADGEIKHTELTESPYVQQLKTYARMLALTRRDLINDDLGALTRLAQAFGRVSAKTLDYVFHALLLANTGTFFGSGNANYWAHADSALDIDALTTVVGMFIDFEDDAGHPMMVEPSILLVSKSNKVKAEQLYNDLFVNETTSTNKPKPANNPHVGNYRPLCSPWLSKTGLFANASDTGWYLIADPSDLAFMELAYLRGQSAPTIESSDTVFNTLGMQWRAYHDFGFAFQDPSAAVFAKGTA